MITELRPLVSQTSATRSASMTVMEAKKNTPVYSSEKRQAQNWAARFPKPSSLMRHSSSRGSNLQSPTFTASRRPKCRQNQAFQPVFSTRPGPWSNRSRMLGVRLSFVSECSRAWAGGIVGFPGPPSPWCAVVDERLTSAAWPGSSARPPAGLTAVERQQTSTSSVASPASASPAEASSTPWSWTAASCARIDRAFLSILCARFSAHCMPDGQQVAAKVNSGGAQAQPQTRTPPPCGTPPLPSAAEC
mmetsp:Transcript_29902/g.93503  ORF Transcript_29902/g.93503 Transcript_29902/m.93503 type:complete len:247 (+) Transcript_29902:1871-2611(+)